MPVQTTIGEQVVVEVSIEASPETIFEFFTDPEKMTRWKGLSASLDPRAGGEYRCQVTPAALALGEFVEIDPPRRVVFTFGWDGQEGVAPGSTTVEVTLEPQGSTTLVRLVHSGLPEEERGNHAEGWKHYWKRLQIVAAGGDAGVDPWTLAEQPQAMEESE